MLAFPVLVCCFSPLPPAPPLTFPRVLWLLHLSTPWTTTRDKFKVTAGTDLWVLGPPLGTERHRLRPSVQPPGQCGGAGLQAGSSSSQQVKSLHSECCQWDKVSFLFAFQRFQSGHNCMQLSFVIIILTIWSQSALPFMYLLKGTHVAWLSQIRLKP